MNEAMMDALKNAMGGAGFTPCELCETPEKCAKEGCQMEKAQRSFMGDKFADRKKGM